MGACAGSQTTCRGAAESLPPRANLLQQLFERQIEVRRRQNADRAAGLNDGQAADAMFDNEFDGANQRRVNFDSHQVGAHQFAGRKRFERVSFRKVVEAKQTNDVAVANDADELILIADQEVAEATFVELAYEFGRGDIRADTSRVAGHYVGRSKRVQPLGFGRLGEGAVQSVAFLLGPVHGLVAFRTARGIDRRAIDGYPRDESNRLENPRLRCSLSQPLGEPAPALL